jgi:hypothetical protein
MGPSRSMDKELGDWNKVDPRVEGPGGITGILKLDSG